MLLQCSSKDQDIIQIHYHDVFCYKILEDIIYLKDGKTIGYTKEHYQKFKKFAVCIKGTFLLIIWLDPDIVRFPVNI